MKLIAPDYYNKFKCIASDCRHSCCIGWEIDIDSRSVQYYNSVGGEIGQKLKQNISSDGSTASFILDENERCPFLEQNGLCQLITQLGKNALCDICTDHPRFRNCFSDRTELGLGLCCEAATELILKQKQPMELIILEDDGAPQMPDEDEKNLLRFRKQLICVAQDRTFSIEERLENLLDLCDLDLPQNSNCEWAEILLSFERLDAAWDSKLELLKAAQKSLFPDDLQIPFEQLLVNFLYRHVPAAIYDYDVKSKVGFAVLSTRLIACILSREETKDFKTLCELCRLYSSEIEYSDENLNLLFDMI